MIKKYAHSNHSLECDKGVPKKFNTEMPRNIFKLYQYLKCSWNSQIFDETLKLFPISFRSFSFGLSLFLSFSPCFHRKAPNYQDTHKRSRPILWMANGEYKCHVQSTRIFQYWMEHQYVCACVIMKMPHYAFLFICIKKNRIRLYFFLTPTILFPHVLLLYNHAMNIMLHTTLLWCLIYEVTCN